MRLLGYLVVALIASGLVVTSVGWYLSANAGNEQRFGSCHFDGNTVVLTYRYGANQAVEPRLDTRGGDLVVSLITQNGTGDTPAIGLKGEARFVVLGGVSPVRYPNGDRLACPRG